MANGAVLVTGGNSGIGFECARALALGGREVLIASRDRKASEVAAIKISQESGAQRVIAMALDLGSLSSVRAFGRVLQPGESKGPLGREHQTDTPLVLGSR